MRRPTIRTTAAVVGCAALLAVAGCGSAASSSTQSSAAPAQQQQQSGPRQGPFSQANMSALAKELGVSATRLQQALTAARSATPPAGGQRPGGDMRTRIAAGLAKQLNLSQTKVQQALAKVMPAPPQGQAPPGSSGTTQS